MPVISKHCVNNSNTLKQYVLFFNYQSLIKHLERNKEVNLPSDKGLYSHINNTTGIAIHNFPDSIRIEDDFIYFLIKFQKNANLHKIIDKKSYILSNNLIDILIKNNFLYALPEFFYNDLIKTQNINYIFNQYKGHFDYIYKMEDLLNLNYLDNSIFLYVLNKVKLTEEELVDYLSENFEYYFHTNNNIDPHKLLKDLNQQYSKDNKLKTNLIDNF